MKNAFRFRALALRASFVAALAVFTLPSFAQNVVQEDGNTIEFIGLKKWTVKQLQDSVRKHDPKGKLGFCAAILKHNLKFCDVSVIDYYRNDTTDDEVITVIEPQDSLLVKRNALFEGADTLQYEWYDFSDKYRKYSSETALAQRTRLLTDDSARIELEKVVKRVRTIDNVIFHEIRTLLRTNPVNIKNLSQITYTSWDPYSRGVAILAMAGLPDNDTCLASIVHGLLDIAPSSVVPAKTSLLFVLKYRKNQIHLPPLYNDLRRLVNGTNLLAYSEVMKLISLGKPTEKDFREIFMTEHSRRLLLAHLRAMTPLARKFATELISTVNPKFASLSEAEQKKYLNIR
jgi:hypothetical protein